MLLRKKKICKYKTLSNNLIIKKYDYVRLVRT